MDRRMDFPRFKIVESDNELSLYARALALPIRIAILRILIEEGCWINHDVFLQMPFPAAIGENHLKALAKLGIVSTKIYNRNKYYSINKDVFQKMVRSFSHLFEYYHQKPANQEIENL